MSILLKNILKLNDLTTINNNKENQSPSLLNSLTRIFVAKINNITEADLVVLNTCHIREKASEKLFSDLGRIKKLKKTKPLKIAVTGCVAQAESKEIISRAPYVDLVLGPQSYHRFPEMLRKIEDGYPTISITEFLTSEKAQKLYGEINFE